MWKCHSYKLPFMIEDSHLGQGLSTVLSLQYLVLAIYFCGKVRVIILRVKPNCAILYLKSSPSCLPKHTQWILNCLGCIEYSSESDLNLLFQFYLLPLSSSLYQTVQHSRNKCAYLDIYTASSCYPHTYNLLFTIHTYL